MSMRRARSGATTAGGWRKETGRPRREERGSSPARRSRWRDGQPAAASGTKSGDRASTALGGRAGRSRAASERRHSWRGGRCAGRPTRVGEVDREEPRLWPQVDDDRLAEDRLRPSSTRVGKRGDRAVEADADRLDYRWRPELGVREVPNVARRGETDKDGAMDDPGTDERRVNEDRASAATRPDPSQANFWAVEDFVAADYGGRPELRRRATTLGVSKGDAEVVGLRLEIDDDRATEN